MSGNAQDDVARLVATGHDGAGGIVKWSVVMVKEAGHWRVKDASPLP